MFIKLALIFILGIIETYLYTGWCLLANKGKALSSSLLMIIYMTMYLTIIAWALKDSQTYLMIFTYALSCGVGNYIRVKHEKS